MQLAPAYIDEFLALRNLEKAIRACGLPSIMVSGQQQLESLSKALKAIDDARVERRVDAYQE